MKTIYLICGRTGTGKTAIVKRVCEDLSMTLLKSYTTRPMRAGEESGSDHIFINSEDVPIYKNDIVAYTKIGDYEYFTTYERLKNSDFYVIDPNGIEYLINTCGNMFKFVVVYISIPLSTILERTASRGDDPERVQQRIESENEQFTNFENGHKWDYCIVNDGSMENAVDQLKQIVRKETFI